MTGPLLFVLFAVVFFIWFLEFAAVWLALVVGCACFGTGLRRLLAERAGWSHRSLPGALLAGGGLALCLAGVVWMAVQQRIPSFPLS